MTNMRKFDIQKAVYELLAFGNSGRYTKEEAEVIAGLVQEMRESLRELRSDGPSPVLCGEYWDCGCEGLLYIHPREQEMCLLCGYHRDESPDSREQEVEAFFAPLRKLDTWRNIVVEVAENNGWSVDIDRNEFEFRKHSPAGRDFSFQADGDCFDELRANVRGYVLSFDPDEETMLWVDEAGHGKNGAPYRLREILEDSEAIEAMLVELMDALAEAESDFSAE